MLTIETARRRLGEVGELPTVTRIGLVLMAAAGSLDVIVHLASGDHAGHQGFSPEHAAHLVGIVGMVFVLAGVVFHGTRRQLRRLAAQPGGLDPNADR